MSVAAKGLEIRLLGDPEIALDGVRKPLPASRKTRALLAYLVMTGRPQLRESLCSMLWDGPDDPRAGLRWSLSKLRPLVAADGVARLHADRERVAIETAGARVDATLLVERAGRDPRELDTEQLATLVDSVRGPFLEGLELPSCPLFHAWCTNQREKLRALQLELLTELVARPDTKLSRALRDARTLVALDPLAESSRMALIRLLSRAGRPRQALEESSDYQRTLERELGIEPSHEMKVLCASLSQLARKPSEPPATLHRVSEPSDEPSSRARVAFVGREAESARVSEFLASPPGAANVLFIVGEPGIGKSRLLEETSERVVATDGLVLAARGFEAEMVRPYGVFVDALRGQALHARASPFRHELSALFPELGPSAAAGSDQGRLFEALGQLLGEIATRRAPLLFVLDDLQWFDEGSIALLHYLSRALRERNVLFAISARRDELADHPSALRLTRHLERERRLARIELSPLEPQEVERLLGLLGRQGDLAELVRESEGNPLFAIELSRAFGVSGGELPGSVSALMSERLGRLDGPARLLLPWAAALGRNFDADVLGRVCGLAPSELLGGLDALERQGVLRAKEDASYDFCHDLLRRAAYRTLSEPRRRLIHAQVARVLATLPDPDATLSGDIFHHAAEGADIPRAIEACIVAGQRCQRLFAFADAVDLSQRGLGLLGALGRRERTVHEIELLGLQIRPQPARLDELEPKFSRAALSARAEGLHEAHARAMYFVSVIRFRAGNVDGAAQSSLEALEPQVGRETPPLALVGTARCLALLQRDMPRVQELLALATPGLPADGTVFDVEWVSGLLARHLGDLPRAALHLERAVGLARVEGAYWEVAEILIWLCVLRLEERSPERALLVARDLREVAAKMGEGGEAPMALALTALARRLQATPEADAELQAALEGLTRADAKAYLSTASNLFAQGEFEAGRYEVAKIQAERARDAARAVARSSELAFARALLARIAWAEGNRSRARAELVELEAELEPAQSLSARARQAIFALSAVVLGAHDERSEAPRTLQRNSKKASQSMPHLVCEYDFDPPLSDEDFSSGYNALKPCLEVRGIRRLRSWLSEDRTRGICEYEAADTQSLRDAYRAASVPFARIWSGKLFEFGTPSVEGP